MRIVSWNVQGGFARKRAALMELGPDVAVLCEVANGPGVQGSLLEGPVCWDARGPSETKQVAVAGFVPGCEPAPGLDEAGRFCAGLNHPELGVLGIWSNPLRPVAYGQEVIRIVQANARWLSHGNVVVAGDLNIDAHGVGNGAGGPALFGRLIDAMGEFGLVSAYHAHTGERFGAESAMTHFHRRDPRAGFHIDYCFVPEAWRERIARCEVGLPETWLGLSDHMPLVIDLG